MNNVSESMLSSELKIDINKKYEYSLSDSLKVFQAFLENTSYVDITKKQILYEAKKIHDNFPYKEWLQNSVNNIGINGTVKQITKGYSKASPYIYFLSMVKVIDINFEDYYNTNPTTLMRIHSWYEQYYDEVGIMDVLKELEDIVINTRNRKLNLDRCKRIALKTLIYLVLRYKLTTIYNLSCEQWSEFIDECRMAANKKKYTKDISNYTNNELLQLSFANLMIFTSVLPTNKNNPKRKKTMISEQMPNIKPIVDIFMKYGKVKWKKSTLQRYEMNLNTFFEYIIKKYDVYFDLSMLHRKDVIEYINLLYAEVKMGKYGYSALESKVLNLKIFLIFVSEHESELKKENLITLKGKIVINNDFKTPSIKYLPRPIESEVLNILLDSLKFVENKMYRLSFMVMLTTGISKIDLLNLKNDCIIFDSKDNSYYLSFFRVKVKKELIIQIQSDVAKIIMMIQNNNTQKIETLHPDGTNTIFLLNDGGKHVDVSWFNKSFEKHIDLAIKQYKHLEDEILKVKPHRLRHTFATIMRDNGADILTLKYLLGHENIATTSKYVKESDKRKVEIIDNIKNNNYYCEAISVSDGEFLNSENGLEFIDKMLSYENDLLIGKCSINGGKNCPMAYKCLDCIYLCSTKEDLDEMIDMLNVLKNQYDKLNEKISETKSNTTKISIELELKRTKRRINILYKKISKIQKTNIDNGLLTVDLKNNNSILNFID